MNRTDGFPIADLDVGLFHDQKVIVLARIRRDERATAVDMSLYVSLVLESWAAGDRVTLDEALPAWWMADIEDSRAALHSAGLIDAESRLPATSWTGWFLPAFDRREKRRESGAEGGRRSWKSRRDKQRFSDASAMPNPSVLPAVPAVKAGKPGRRPAAPPLRASPAGSPEWGQLPLGKYPVHDQHLDELLDRFRSLSDENLQDAALWVPVVEGGLSDDELHEDLEAAIAARQLLKERRDAAAFRPRIVRAS